MYEICDTCKYWELIDEPKNTTLGRCRIEPPQILAEFGAFGIFPITDLTDWCGGWGDKDHEKKRNNV